MYVSIWIATYFIISIYRRMYMFRYTKKDQERRVCKTYVELDRSLRAQEQGMSICIFASMCLCISKKGALYSLFISPSCKNHKN